MSPCRALFVGLLVPASFCWPRKASLAVLWAAWRCFISPAVTRSGNVSRARAVAGRLATRRKRLLGLARFGSRLCYCHLCGSNRDRPIPALLARVDPLGSAAAIAPLQLGVAWRGWIAHICCCGAGMAPLLRLRARIRRAPVYAVVASDRHVEHSGVRWCYGTG